MSANKNPIILDALGEALVWLDPAIAYKFVLQTSSGVEVWTVDNITRLTPTTFWVEAKTRQDDWYVFNCLIVFLILVAVGSFSVVAGSFLAAWLY